VDSSSEEEDQHRRLQRPPPPPPPPPPPLQKGGRGKDAAAGKPTRILNSIPSSPLSPDTTTSNNPLANLLAAASSKPPSARPPPSKKATEKKSAAAGGGAAKRKHQRGRTIPEEDADQDFIGSPPSLSPSPRYATTTAPATGVVEGATDGNEDLAGRTDLWSLKYDPRTPEDLIVHKKKVEEVSLWLQIQLHAAGTATAPGHTNNRLLIVTGPPGCGKTATLRTLGDSLGFTITEWQAQAEASYQEINYLNNNNNSHGRYEERLGYVSKIAAFEEFASRAKMPALPLSTITASSRHNHSITTTNTTADEDLQRGSTTRLPPVRAGPLRPSMVFIDDLPFTSDLEQRRRLARAVSNLARSARFPVVLFATEASGRSQQQGKNEKAAPDGLPKELAQALEALPGVETINFNPITALKTAKVLRDIVKKESQGGGPGFFSDGQIVAIAEQSGGDLRNAINSLQFASTTGVKPVQQKQLGKQPAAKKQRHATTGNAKSNQKKEARVTENDVDTVAFMLRDTSLGLFHGLGKLLYNKRLPPVPEIVALEEDDSSQALSPATATALAPLTSTAAPATATKEVLPCVGWLQRRHMDGFNPDDVLTDSGLEATSVNAFLHENLPHFIQDSEIFDLAMCLGQLSTSDVLSSVGKRRRNDLLNAGDDAPGGTTIADACAAMVAARGVCFWNTHPAPRQWQPLKAPALFTVQRGIAANSEQLHEAAGVGRVVYGGSGGLDSASLLGTELLPAVRLVCQNIRAPFSAPKALVYQQPGKWTRFWNGKLHETVMHDGVGGRGTAIDVENYTREQTSGGGGGAQNVGRGVLLEDDPIEDSDDDI
jgi:cell cycle checkpoint protein